MTWLGFHASQTPCPFAPGSPIHSILEGNATASFLTSGDLELLLKKHLCDSAEFCLHSEGCFIYISCCQMDQALAWVQSSLCWQNCQQVQKQSRPSQLLHTCLSSIARSRTCWRLIEPPSSLLKKASDDLC